MQHNRDLEIVKNEAQRIIHDAMIWVKDSEQQALGQSRKIDVLQSQINQLSQLVKQQQQTPSNIATTPTQCCSATHFLYTTTHAHTVIHTHTRSIQPQFTKKPNWSSGQI